MKNLITLFFVFLFAHNLISQVVTSDPAFPTVKDEVTITFDATKGTAGLKDCNCDVYIHTGVITDKSTSPGDWKYVVTSWGQANSAWKMTKVAGEDNLYNYIIGPDILSYYGIAAEETVKKLAFVFRNNNGSKEGKDTGGQDIFIDVYPETTELAYNLISPAERSMIVNLNEIIPVQLLLSRKADITLYLENTEIISVNDSIFNYELTADHTGTQRYKIQLISDPDTVNIPFSFTVPLPNHIADLPSGVEDGISLTSDTTGTLVLFAPGKQHVFVIGDFNNWDFSSDYQMKNTPDGKRWWIELNELEKNTVYGFQYVVDATIRIGDPYTHIVLDPYHDKFIENYNYPGLKPYPYDKTTGIASVLSTKPDTFQWKYDDYIRPDKDRLIIYELLLRDFLEDHSYVSLIDTLDYLERLGINAIELMPVNEFEGNNSWGYNPSYHMALDKYYGSPDEFKAFVDECHRRGIAVILDIVYNHAFRQSPLVGLYWDEANKRPAADSPWFNQVPKHPFNVGYDFNHESEATKYFTKRGLRYWIDEYKVDGYRFDLSKGFTQRQSSNNDQMSAYDDSRIAILKDYAGHIWEIDPDFYVILEHFASNTEEKVLSDYGMMLWGNNNYQYNEATMGYASNINNLTHKQRGWNDMNLVGYMESHDEERLMYKNLQYGNSSGSYSVKDLDTSLDRMKLAGAFFFLVPGPKMIWQFVETGYDFSLFTCPNGSVSENCKLDPKPIKWDYYKIPARRKLFDTYSALISLKKKYNVFNTDDFTTSLSSYLKSIHLNHNEMKVTIIGNFDVKPGQIDPKFQHIGLWYDFFSGDSINVINPNILLTLQAGEFRIYSDMKLDRSILNDVNEKEPEKKAIIYPNPAGTEFRIITPEIEVTGLEVTIFDISGREVLRKTLKQDNRIDISRAGLTAGVYIVKLSGNYFFESHKLVVGNL